MSPFFCSSMTNRLSKPLVLASRSPRRLRLLRQIGIEPQVVPCDIPEEFDVKSTAARNALILAEAKARTVAAGMVSGCVLGADTIVSVDTGFAVIDCPSGSLITGVEETAVHFRELPDEEIDEYVRGGSPLDKAGGYGIQDDYGAVFVRRVEGCYYNVVGLPLSAVYTALIELGVVVRHGKES